MTDFRMVSVNARGVPSVGAAFGKPSVEPDRVGFAPVAPRFVFVRRNDSKPADWRAVVELPPTAAWFRTSANSTSSFSSAARCESWYASSALRPALLTASRVPDTSTLFVAIWQ